MRLQSYEILDSKMHIHITGWAVFLIAIFVLLILWPTAMLLILAPIIWTVGIGIAGNNLIYKLKLGDWATGIVVLVAGAPWYIGGLYALDVLTRWLGWK